MVKPLHSRPLLARRAREPCHAVSTPPTEPMDETNLARILDASANRAREALRVLEDYCRFVLNDAVLN